MFICQETRTSAVLSRQYHLPDKYNKLSTGQNFSQQQLNVTKISQNLKGSSRNQHSLFFTKAQTSEQAKDKYYGSESDKANYTLGTICSNFQHNPILNLKECNEIESRHNFCTGF